MYINTLPHSSSPDQPGKINEGCLTSMAIIGRPRAIIVYQANTSKNTRAVGWAACRHMQPIVLHASRQQSKHRAGTYTRTV